MLGMELHGHNGQDIDGEAASDYSGMSVSMNAAGDHVAIGARYNDGNGSNAGHVRMYYDQRSGKCWFGQCARYYLLARHRVFTDTSITNCQPGNGILAMDSPALWLTLLTFIPKKGNYDANL